MGKRKEQSNGNLGKFVRFDRIASQEGNKMAKNRLGVYLFRSMLALVLFLSLVMGPAQQAAAAPAEAFAGWLGEYHSNADLSGSPQFIRDDAAIDFDWGYGTPASVIPADGFSVRWTRSLYFAAGTYRFFAMSDDGIRVWLDGEAIIDQWHVSPGTTYAADRYLNAGTHLIRVEYYEQGGGAKVHFWWEASAPQVFPDWKGEYYSNSGLDGSPAWVRNDYAINFDWGYGAPSAGLPADSFSARWTRKSYLEAATYRFHAIVDGAVCLWVGDQLVLETWADGASREIVAEYTPARGEYYIKVEFFERSGRARIQVWWEKVYQPYRPEPAYPDWRGQYWSNMELAGRPALVRNDGAIDFDWNLGAAADGLPADRFSVRWDGRFTFQRGTYTFYAQADNGIRVYLDGELIIDQWYTNSEQLHRAARTLEGSHHLAVEYYDNGGEAQARFWWR